MKFRAAFSAAVLLIFVCQLLNAQCILPVSSYPYSENWDSGNGGWVDSGLTGNDWVLGTPAKPTINAAFSAPNCWIVGGLTGSTYANGERSWVKSPCFDFSSLKHPEVSFKIYWETEYHYDGSNLQYSLDGGSTWSLVGTYNEPVDCHTQNWYNYNSIVNLNGLSSPTNGWSGTHFPSGGGGCQGGNGSMGWVTATHCLSFLAFQPHILFRFTFGAGTTCNNYDGVAIDNFEIRETTPPVADFTFQCSGASTISFTDASTNCAENWSWNFGDNATSVQQSPSHTYTSAGSYTATLIASNACSGADTIQKTVNVISTALSTTPESCPGSHNGSASVVVTPAGGLAIVSP